MNRPQILLLLLFFVPLVRADIFFEQTVMPVLQEHCLDCHDPEDSDGDVIFLDARKPEDLAKHRKTWRSVAEQLRNYTMPPPKRKSQPTEDERNRIAEWIRYQLRESASKAGPYAGWVKARRLNRLEYDNTIRDLVGVNLNFSETFPLEGGGGEGFDNNSETLFLPPLLMERYMEAAQQIVDAAIVTPLQKRAFDPGEMLPERAVGDDSARRLGKGDEVSVLLPVYVTGEYELRLGAAPIASQSVELSVAVDGLKAETVRLERNRSDSGRAGWQSVRLRLPRGLHAISFGCGKDGEAEVFRVEVEEQKRPANFGRASVHHRLLGVAPGAVPDEPRVAAERVLRGFMARAFRRPLRSGEVERFVRLYDRAEERGDPFEERMKLAIKGVLLSPHFLFRIEKPPTGNGIEALGDHELASRLSYFLWSTMPDAELIELATAGELGDETVLRKQVDRMVRDSRFRTFSKSFVGQWLGTKDVGGRVAPTQNSIQHYYTPEVAAAMREEAVLYFHQLVQNDRSVLELIDADYTYLSGRLAKFYERDDWKRFKVDEFERVALTDGRRGGLLGMGAVLALTSHFKQTSPILRGAWILDTLLGTPVPPPPPNVPPAPKKDKQGKKLSTREMLALHRENTSCAACHNLIDPIGFGLENFDFLGRWRDEAGGKPIDVSGSLPSGETFAGPKELKTVLLRRSDVFVRHLIRKVLGYALGRSLVDEDDSTIERIARRLEAGDRGAGQLIAEVVLSVPFRNKQPVDGDN